MIHICVGKLPFGARVPDRQNLLPWRDDLSVGPVPRTDSLEDLSRIREAFWNTSTPSRRLNPHPGKTSSLCRDLRFRELDPDAEVVIWYGQNRREVLMLAAILHFWTGSEDRISLVFCGGSWGTGVCNPDDCAEAFGRRELLKRECADGLRRLWQAYTASDPSWLNEIARSSMIAPPWLPQIARRILDDYPATDTGLSLLEERVLQQVSEDSSVVTTVAETMGACEEPIGDGLLFELIWDMIHSNPPLLEIREEKLPFATAAAFRVARIRRGSAAASTLRSRWIGGVEIKGDDFPWRYDRLHCQVRFLDRV